MKRLSLSIALLASCGMVSSASATVFGSNLIVNGDAEIGTGAPSGAVVPVFGFTTTGNFTLVAYNEPGGFPVTGDPGVSTGGVNLFTGGPSNAFSSAFQLIDLAPGGALIDAGTSTFALSAFLGGFFDQADDARLLLEFLDGANTLQASYVLGPISLADRGNQTGLLLTATSGAVPVGARTARVTLDMTRFAGAYNDGYADNLSLVLQSGAVPEASTWAMMLAGFGLMGGVLRVRRRQYTRVRFG